MFSATSHEGANLQRKNLKQSLNPLFSVLLKLGFPLRRQVLLSASSGYMAGVASSLRFDVAGPGQQFGEAYRPLARDILHRLFRQYFRDSHT